MSSEKVLSRINKEPGFGLQAVLAAQKETGAPAALADPPEDVRISSSPPGAPAASTTFGVSIAS